MDECDFSAGYNIKFMCVRSRAKLGKPRLYLRFSAPFTYLLTYCNVH